MRRVQEIAGWFMNHEFNPTNNIKGNLKLNKLLYFSQLISLIKTNKPLFNEDLYAFENGVVVESVRCQYKEDFFNFVQDSKKIDCKFNDQELEILNLTKDIFLEVSPDDLSKLTHEHISWNEHFNESKRTASKFKYNKAAAKINIEDYFTKFKSDLDLIKEIIDAKENSDDVFTEKVLVLNGVSYYYNPNELTIDDNVMTQITKFPATDKAYTLYMDESQGLIIF